MKSKDMFVQGRQPENNTKKVWETPEIEILPVPDLTQGGAGSLAKGDAPGAPDYQS